MTKHLKMVGTLAMLLAAVPATAQLPEDIVFDGNILWQNKGAGGVAKNYFGGSGLCGATSYTDSILATVYFTHNRVADPLLTDPYNQSSPRWDPMPGSPAIGGNANSAVVNWPDPWFEKVCYAGAVPPRSSLTPDEDWTTGWTYFNNAGGAGRTDINYAKPLVTLSGPQPGNVHMVNTNNYLLTGRVSMQRGWTLTIDPGTVIFGDNAVTSFLVIERGAQIIANGTKEQPIIFTSAKSPGSMAPGDWAGVIILGKAICNCANTAAGDSCAMEGGPGYFGGNDDNDNSGSLRYMRVEYAGFELSPNNELNCLTFAGVGRGTTVDYIECMQGSDDTFEWFGGTANAKHLVSVGGNDDSLDWQMGYRGFIQFEIVQQWGLFGGDKGIEADNNEFNFNADQRSNPVVANCTFVGTGPGTGGSGAIHLRRGTAGTIINSIIMGWKNTALRMENAETFANCAGADPGVYCSPTIDVEPVEQDFLSVACGPSPTAGQARISFTLPASSPTTVQVFDLGGRLVATLADGFYTSGPHSVTWDSSRQAAGTYFYRVSAIGQARVGKIVVTR